MYKANVKILLIWYLSIYLLQYFIWDAQFMISFSKAAAPCCAMLRPWAPGRWWPSAPGNFARSPPSPSAASPWPPSGPPRPGEEDLQKWWPYITHNIIIIYVHMNIIQCIYIYISHIYITYIKHNQEFGGCLHPRRAPPDALSWPTGSAQWADSLLGPGEFGPVPRDPYEL